MNDVAITESHSHEIGQICVAPVRVTLLGQFSVGLSGTTAGPWPRPSAKRLCELLMLSTGHRALKEALREVLFPNLPPEASAHALSKAVSMARRAFMALGEAGPQLLQAGRDHISIRPTVPLAIDLLMHETELRSGLAMRPGRERDAQLSTALRQTGVLLENEPYCDWALAPRDALERLRQRARLELARDRTDGHGLSHIDALIDSWDACLAHDTASEEAAINLMMCYASVGQRQLVARTYRSCRQGLRDLDLEPSSALETTYEAATKGDVYLVAPWSWSGTAKALASKRLAVATGQAAASCPASSAPGLELRQDFVRQCLTLGQGARARH